MSIGTVGCGVGTIALSPVACLPFATLLAVRNLPDHGRHRAELCSGWDAVQTLETDHDTDCIQDSRYVSPSKQCTWQTWQRIITSRYRSSRNKESTDIMPRNVLHADKCDIPFVLLEYDDGVLLRSRPINLFASAWTGKRSLQGRGRYVVGSCWFCRHCWAHCQLMAF